jgi:aminoglycoside phosphotransferase family enzyme/predicted kinase
MMSERSDAPTWAECHETNLSAVFMAGDYVLKFKKPVRTDFVDFTSVEARDWACEQEASLNSRLSPDVYLGVVHVGLSDSGPGEPVVVMRRLDDTDQLGTRLEARDSAVREGIRDTARSVAVFHADCDVDTSSASPGCWEKVREGWIRENADLERLGGAVAGRETRQQLLELGLFFLDGRRDLFDERLNSGQVVEGHGDLRCEHIYLTTEGIRIIDCVEFDRSLRIADVLADVAFLAMDLERLGFARHAAAFLDHYREFSASSYPDSLLDFYIAYRAVVRAKVGAIRTQQTGVADPSLNLLLEIATSHLRRAAPVVVCLGGLPGSGKSSVSEELARATSVVHLSSDEIRHGLVPPDVVAAESTRWEEGAYTPAITTAVYTELLNRAEAAISNGCSVVLDASWRDEVQRERAHELARACSAVAVDVVCEVSANAADRRLARGRGGYSQAGALTRDAMTIAFDSWPAAGVLTTDRDAHETGSALRDLVQQSVDNRFPPLLEPTG